MGLAEGHKVQIKLRRRTSIARLQARPEKDTTDAWSWVNFGIFAFSLLFWTADIVINLNTAVPCILMACHSL